MSTWELLGNITTCLSIILAARNHILTWSTGIVGSIFFAVMFYQAKLYADVSLQFFFIVTSIWGWVNWSRPEQGEKEKKITKTSARWLSFFVFAGALCTALYGWILHSVTDASFPFIDSIILMGSIIAQFLLMERKLENWFFWLGINSVAIPLYAIKGLYLTSLLYAFYWVNAIWGYYKWRGFMKEAV